MNYYVFAGLCVIFTATGQVLLKLGARDGAGFYRLYLNRYTMGGYFTYLLVTVCSVLALGGIMLKSLYAMISVTYVLVALMSWVVLKEPLTRNKLIAVLLVLGGVVVFNL
jgi:drug/metabolite transporter (DMT)-like permease